MDWEGIRLYSVDELTAKLSHQSEMVQFLREYHSDPRDRSLTVQAWYKFAKNSAQRVRVVEADIPAGILPDRVQGDLRDFKVGCPRKGRVPDDAMYNRHEDLREKIARGNTVMYLHDHQESSITYDCLIFALRKFTGGMGDEDEDQPDDQKTWMKYFLRPVEQTSRIICTQKANGEAAHFSARYLKDRFIVAAGSKNVHLVCRTYADIAKYSDSRYMVAKTVAESTLDMLCSLTPENASILLSFMHHTQVTGVFEVLQPHYQHVVDLSHLKASQMNFICFTLPYGIESKKNQDSLCALSPDKSLDFARSLGMITIDYETIEADQGEARMDLVRQGYGSEGEVFYYVDNKGHVIGLLKKKTAWYILCRAIREKASHAVLDYIKERNGKFQESDRINKLKSRIKQIQTWLGFDDEYRTVWEDLGSQFMKWLIARAAKNEVQPDKVRGFFPGLWNQFLVETNSSDRVEWRSA